MSEFKRKLRCVWEHATPIGESVETALQERWRYVPKSLDGGTGWGVWDHKRSRFLSDREVKTTPSDKLSNERVLHA
jgi:hypothetical protein